MDTRSSADVFVSLTLFCAALQAQQPDYFVGGAPEEVSVAMVGNGIGDGFVSDPVYPNACSGGCASGCDCCNLQPHRIFPQCDDGLNFSGWLNAGFVGNTSSPASKFNGPYNAVDRSNELMMNQAYFIAEKKLSDDGCFDIGGRMDVLYGEDYFLAQSVGIENHDDGSPHWNSEYYGVAVPQAYLAVGRKDLYITAGHFYSIIGYEGLPATSNFFYTKAYSYQFAGPFTHWGGLATWAPSEPWELQFGVTNGWDTFDREPSDHANILAKIKYIGDYGGYTSFGVVTGEDISNPGSLPTPQVLSNRTRYSWIISLPVGCNTEYVFHQWLGSQDQGALDGGTAYWYGLDQYLYYTINDCWKSGLRFEWFRDEDGTRVGLNRPSNPNNVPFVGNFYSVSAGLNWSPTTNLTFRPEIRADWFNGDQAVQPFDDGDDDSQVLLGMDAIWLF